MEEAKLKSFIDYDQKSLENAYQDMKRSHYQSFLKFWSVVILIVSASESAKDIFPFNFNVIPKLVAPLPFLIAALLYLSKPRKNQDFFCTIFFLLFYFVGLSVHHQGKGNFFLTPQDSFSLGAFFGIFDRLVAERISNSRYKKVFSILCLLFRVLIIPVSNGSILVRQFIILGATLYLDVKRDQQDRHLFRGYFDYKEQLVKFKQLVVHDIPEAIVVVSGDLSQSLLTNKAFKDLLGEKAFDDIRSQLQQFFTQPPSSSKIKTLLDFIQDMQIIPQKKFECNLKYFKEPSSEEHLFQAKLLPITWDNQAALAIVLHDVTQQRTILSLQIADNHKDKVLATVSHELRTPLNGILGVVQIMQKRIQDPELLHFLSICKNSSNLLIGLVNSILDLNQIRFKKLELRPEKIDIHAFFKDIIGLFEFQCQQKKLFLKTNTSNLKTRFIVTDKNRLSQIFINLVGNALKFTFEGGITIHASESHDGDSDLVDFDVVDSGIGIKQEDQGKLFQIFGKLNQKVNVNHEGIGLGLTISDALVKVLKGGGEEEELTQGIMLQSAQNKGSCFSFSIKKNIKKNLIIPSQINQTLTECSVVNEFDTKNQDRKMEYLTQMPGEIANFFEKLDSHIRLKSARSSLTPKIPLSQLTAQDPQILIVDDNPFNLTVARHLVLLCGYNVKTALHGKAAIELLLNNNHANEPIKLIFMDCQMPIMDGYQTTKALKELMLKKKIPYIPIVALTANDSKEDRKYCIDSGMVDHIAKPLQEKELKKIIKQYC